MGTILSKDLVRVSTEKVDDKEIIITLTSNQEIELKLKGTRGNGKAIYIKDLYEQLYGNGELSKRGKDGPITISVDKVKSGKLNSKMISLYDLRAHNAISNLDIETIAKFDQIIKSVIDSI